MARTKRTVVILVSGKAGSGKSTVAEMLAKKLQNEPSLRIFPYGFADPIKYLAKSYFGWDGEKDERGRRLLQQIGFVGREYDEDIWVKHFLQQLDKRAGLLPFHVAIISDWRFPNELNFLERNPLLDTISIRVFGRGGLSGEGASDVSENSLIEVGEEVLLYPLDYNDYAEEFDAESGFIYDYQINNECTVEELEKKVETVLTSISEQYIVKETT